MGRIVVGVDGSENSLVALHWALEEAEHRHAIVEAVIAWQYPYTGVGFAPYVDADGLEEGASLTLQEALRVGCPDEAVRERIQQLVIQETSSRRWSTRPRAPTSSSSARAVEAASPVCCSAR